MKNKAANILITKASGELLPFDPEKLRKSLKRAGATGEAIDMIVQNITERLYENVPTKKIYKWAFSLLKSQSSNTAAKYHLKNGIMELGPSGFPFEKFVSEILKRQGYSVQVGKIVKGKCVSHEIDVIAEKEDKHFMIECKYHNRHGTVCDVKIPLYVQARFEDVKASWSILPGHETKLHQGWVVTNTRFTTDAIRYGNCAGLNLIGWDYPNGNSLRSQIDTFGLYPITCLTGLTKTEKQLLLNSKYVLCSDLCDRPQILSVIGIKPSRAAAILEEGKRLCASKERNG